MQLTNWSPLALAILLPALEASAQSSQTLCGANKLPNCPAKQICVKPAPNVRCDPQQLQNCPGTCQPSCSLNDNSQPCQYGQKCTQSPLAFGDKKLGFCPEPAFCGGIAGIQCEGTGETCIDDPRDDCDPKTGGADCGGICVVEREQPTDQSCGGFTGKLCPEGYECVDNPKDTCDPKKGGADCSGLCVVKRSMQPEKKRLCDSRGLPPCRKGETCVHEPGCDAAVDCPGVCTATKICATLTGIQCDEGENCVDDPDNGCSGGIAADCPGKCVKA